MTQWEGDVHNFLSYHVIGLEMDVLVCWFSTWPWTVHRKSAFFISRHVWQLWSVASKSLHHSLKELQYIFGWLLGLHWPEELCGRWWLRDSRLLNKVTKLNHPNVSKHCVDSPSRKLNFLIAEIYYYLGASVQCPFPLFQSIPREAWFDDSSRGYLIFLLC